MAPFRAPVAPTRRGRLGSYRPADTGQSRLLLQASSCPSSLTPSLHFLLKQLTLHFVECQHPPVNRWVSPAAKEKSKGHAPTIAQAFYRHAEALCPAS